MSTILSKMCQCIQIDGGPCQNLPGCPIIEIKILLEEGSLREGGIIGPSGNSHVAVDAKSRATNLGCSFCHRHSFHWPWCPAALSLRRSRCTQWPGTEPCVYPKCDCVLGCEQEPII